MSGYCKHPHATPCGVNGSNPPAAKMMLRASSGQLNIKSSDVKSGTKPISWKICGYTGDCHVWAETRQPNSAKSFSFIYARLPTPVKYSDAPNIRQTFA